MRRFRYSRVSLFCAVAGLALVRLGFAGDAPAGSNKARNKAEAAAASESLDAKAAQASKAAQEAASGAATAEAEAAAATAAKAASKKAKSAGKTKPPGKEAPAAPPAAAVAAPVTQPAGKAGVDPGKVPPATAVAPVPPPVPKEWPAQDIELATARCNAVLKGIDAVTTPEPAFRNGECGAPAAVRLVSVGKNPQVAFSPVPIVTCDMAVALHTWVKNDVQPLARKHLSADIVKIETMSDYACRNAYGRTRGKLSEHGRANALDIRGFVTAKAVPAYVLENWGPIQREIAAQEAAKAAAKLAANKAAAGQLAADKALKAAGTSTPAKAQPEPSVRPPSGGRGTIIDGVPEVAGSKGSAANPAMGFQPSRLGGPKDKDAKAKAKADATEIEETKEPAKDKSKKRPTGANDRSKPEATPAGVPAAARAGAPVTTPVIVKGTAPGDKVAIFLHEVHAAACRTFGTTLGPEANNDHRNHFHIDMAPRAHKKICD